jgi:hypothetical protein
MCYWKKHLRVVLLTNFGFTACYISMMLKLIDTILWRGNLAINSGS